MSQNQKNLPSLLGPRLVLASSLKKGDVIRNPKGDMLTIRHKKTSVQIVPARKVKMIFLSTDGHGFGGGVVNASLTHDSKVELVSRNTWWFRAWQRFIAWRNRDEAFEE